VHCRSRVQREVRRHESNLPPPTQWWPVFVTCVTLLPLPTPAARSPTCYNGAGRALKYNTLHVRRGPVVERMSSPTPLRGDVIYTLLRRAPLPVRFEARLLGAPPRGYVGWSTDWGRLLTARSWRSRYVFAFALCAAASWSKHKRLAWRQRTKAMQPLSTLSDGNLVRVRHCSHSSSGRRSCSHAAGANNIVQAELTAWAEDRSECRGTQRDNDAASVRGCCSTGSSRGRSLHAQRQRRIQRRM